MATKQGAQSAAVSDRRIDLAFDDNQLAIMLFGEFDQNLALLEKRLGVHAVAHGNMVTITGSTEATAQARRVLEALYDRLLEGHEILQGDVEGAIRMTEAPDSQLPLPTMDESSRMRFARIATRKKSIVARTIRQDDYIRAMDRCELVFGIGPAGTGKTYLAVAFAAALLERGDVERIILSRPAVEAGERLGFLPGDMREKVDPYLKPLYDALYDMMPGDKVEKALASQPPVIEVAPLAFMRGRTLSNAVVILDEAQNTTSMQMKMFLTRIGENSKMVVTGDPSQVDLKSGERSGLAEATRLLRGIEGVDMIEFSGSDVVRHALVQRIVDAYDAVQANSGRLREDGDGR